MSGPVVWGSYDVRFTYLALTLMDKETEPERVRGLSSHTSRAVGVG